MVNQERGPAPVTPSDPRWDSDEMLRFLGDPGSYDHAPTKVELIQTHASFVAIAPPFVFKVKKPLDLGFLDFSSLEKRKHFCEEEVRLNRRLCDDMYQGIEPIYMVGGRLAFGGQLSADEDSDDRPAEYAVRMRLLKDGFFMQQLVNDGRVGGDDLRRVAEKLTSFYRSHPASERTSRWGRPERIRISTDENFEQIEPHVGQLLTRPAFETIRFYADRFLDCNTALLEQRRAGGKILDCHGDLHLEHIHITPQSVCIYDCIEFNERLRYIDVANDIAFLAMDLDFNGRRDLSWSFAQMMAELMSDESLPGLLTFYKCYRAVVRGKVACLRTTESEIEAASREEAAIEARQYFELALQYAISGDNPDVIVVMGRVGTGKSTQAATLGASLGWRVFSSDVIRKTLAGVPLQQRGDETERALLYTGRRSEETYNTLTASAVAEARHGRGAVLDATFGRRAHRDTLRRELLREGVRCRFVEIVAPDDVIRGRLRQREEAADVVSDARVEDYDMLVSRYESPNALEDRNHFQVTSEATPELTTKMILQQLVRLS